MPPRALKRRLKNALPRRPSSCFSDLLTVCTYRPSPCRWCLHSSLGCTSSSWRAGRRRALPRVRKCTGKTSRRPLPRCWRPRGAAPQRCLCRRKRSSPPRWRGGPAGEAAEARRRRQALTKGPPRPTTPRRRQWPPQREGPNGRGRSVPRRSRSSAQRMDRRLETPLEHFETSTW